MSASAETGPAQNGGHHAVKRQLLAKLVNEFAAVGVSLDTSGNGPRLLVEDLESGDHIFLSPLELASLCLASDEDREDWIRVGNYRESRESRDPSFGRGPGGNGVRA
ncbi:hypothetical protein SAMN02745947_05039 [Rhodococcus rhodochrous J3]|uniref:Uncharacterized protein n=2 Tax=Rhodococcus rhodochrous TaxID=1829 RepID=A0AA46X0J2_RHORH|nr:hypothetical protein [Rhodococcus rhodochrous]UZF47838.1 hypothetical protein KUM34_025785 [Rhodococcus rhodochrous]SMG57402.1 hypothetical protein SAMN02745947_05039 [Rhodococcus rhodochrous J3]